MRNSLLLIFSRLRRRDLDASIKLYRIEINDLAAHVLGQPHGKRGLSRTGRAGDRKNCLVVLRRDNSPLNYQLSSIAIPGATSTK